MLDKFKAWWARPYDDGMSVTGWFLFFGFMIVISVLWGLVLREMKAIVD